MGSVIIVKIMSIPINSECKGGFSLGDALEVFRDLRDTTNLPFFGIQTVWGVLLGQSNDSRVDEVLTETEPDVKRYRVRTLFKLGE